MRTVYRTESLIDAHLVHDALEQAGIPAFIAGEYLSDGLGRLSGCGFISVAVPDSAEEAAAPHVAELATMFAQARLPDPKPRDAADGGWVPLPA